MGVIPAKKIPHLGTGDENLSANAPLATFSHSP